MHRDADRYEVFSRRSFLLTGGKVALFSLLAGRMYYLQVVEADRYATLADENRISIRLLAPSRGRIIDRFGKPLAVNRQNYRALIIPEDTLDPGGTLEALDAIISIGAHDRQRVLRDVKRGRKFLPVIVREGLSWREVSRIEVNAPDLAGVTIDVGESRYYPHPTETAPVLGYVSAVSDKEMDGDPLLELPGFRIGKAGIEKVHDKVLRGRNGTKHVEVNALGRTIRELERAPAQPGKDVRLNIDLELQKFTAARLEGESASAVVIDIHTGEVLALASTPSFDPNSFNRGLSASEWRSLVSNVRAPLHNKAIAGQYAPGSTFKMVVALAAMKKGVTKPSTRVFCTGEIKLGNAVFHCWKRGGHGWVDLRAAIVQSCDVFFYETARRTGIDRISAMARRLGMGSRLAIDLPGEKSGLMPSRAWKLEVKGVPWQKGETLLAGIGQGYLLATPLQLAVMTARLVNGGFAVAPKLTRQIVAADGSPASPLKAPEFPKIGVDPDRLEWIRSAMAAVVNQPGGTAYRARIKQSGFEMGGKTGTVQVRRISKAERERGVRKNKDRAWIERDHAMFVGFAPIDAPRYAVSVVIEHGGSGAGKAAPVARDILLKVQRRDPSRRRAADGFAGNPGTPEG